MPASALKGSDALVTVLLSLSLFFLAGPLLAPRGAWGMALTQFIAFAGPVLLLAATRPRGFDAVGLSSPGLGMLIPALLLGATLWYWNALWIGPIGAEWSSPEEAEELSRQLAIHSRPLYESIFFFALVPALCEELLHRGLILPALSEKVGAGLALVLGGLFFRLSHLSPARLLPTAILGIAAGGLRLASGSLWPAVLLHFLYNALLLFAAKEFLELQHRVAIPALIISVIAAQRIHKHLKSQHLPKSNG